MHVYLIYCLVPNINNNIIPTFRAVFIFVVLIFAHPQKNVFHATSFPGHLTFFDIGIFYRYPDIKKVRCPGNEVGISRGFQFRAIDRGCNGSRCKGRKCGKRIFKDRGGCYSN